MEGPAGGGEETLFHEGPVSATYNFVVIDDGIYFTNVGGTLDFIDFKTGRARTVCKIDKSWWWGLSISPGPSMDPLQPAGSRLQ